MIKVKLEIYKLIIVELIQLNYIKLISINESISNIKNEFLIQKNIELKQSKNKTSLGSTHGVNIKYTLIEGNDGEFYFPEKLINICKKCIIDNEYVYFNNKEDYISFLIITEGKPFNSLIYDNSIIKKEFKNISTDYKKIKYNENFSSFGLGKNSLIFFDSKQKEYVFLNKIKINYMDYYDFNNNKFLNFDKIKEKVIQLKFLQWLKNKNINLYENILINMENIYLKKIEFFSNKIKQIQ